MILDFLVSIIHLEKFANKNATFFALLKNIRIYIIFFILIVSLKNINLYYICYIVGVVEKDKYNLLQYESAKYLYLYI